jgi:hypothetical protein
MAVNPTQVFEFDCLIPAGTPKTAPVTVAMAMPARVVTSIEVKVPPGPNGVMGFQIGASGRQVIPGNLGAFIVTSDETINWDQVDQIDSGAWQLFGYNTGIYPHTVYVRFVVSQVAVGAVVSTPAPIDPALISSDVTGG